MSEPIRIAELRERAEAGDEAYRLGSIDAPTVLALLDVAEAAHEYLIGLGRYIEDDQPIDEPFDHLRDALTRLDFTEGGGAGS